MIQNRQNIRRVLPEPEHRNCVHAFFEAQVEKTPGAVALSGRGWTMTYQELNEQANRLAHHLRSLGVVAETVVGLLLPRSREAMVGMLAILKSGGAYLPLDPSYPNERLRFLVTDSGAQLVLSQSGSLPPELDLPAPLLLLDRAAAQLDQAPTGNPAPVATGSSLAYLIYTSGSTGTPKGVQIEHAGIGNLVLGQTYFTFGPQEVHLMLSSLAFDFSTLELWGALLNGSRLAIYEPAHLSLPELGRTIKEQGVTTLMVTPGVLNHLVTECLPDLAGLSRVLTGGDVAAAKTVQLLLGAVPGCEFVNLYGPTENTVLTTAYTVRGLAALEANVPIGRAIHGTEVFVMTDGGERALPGEVGELWMGGAGLARGYANRPELTAAHFVPHPFDPRPGARLYRSGDLARERPDGNLEFLGRRDYQVKIRGHRIELPEIERVMGEHPEVQEAVVLALPQGQHHEKRLVAFVEVVPSARQPAAGLFTGDLRQYLGARLPGYMVPSLMVHVEAFPLGPTGKVDRHALSAWPLPGHPGGDASASVPTLSATESRLSAVWTEVLGAAATGTHPDPQADFFALGGTSLQAALLLSRVATLFGTDLAPGVLFEQPTLRALAALIDAQCTDTALTTVEGVVCLRRPSARNAGAAPLILIGDPFLYRQVLMGLSLDAPIYAVDQEVRDVTEMADAALARLRRAGIAGPYRLAGFSFDGLVAYELARQLQGQGEQVTFLGLIDTATPEIERLIQMPLVAKLALFLRHPAWLMVPGWRRYLTREVRLSALHLVRPNASVFQQQNGRYQQCVNAAQHYRPGNLDASLTLYSAEAELSGAFDPLLGWGHLTGGQVRVERVRGSHLDLMLSAEGSRRIGALIGAALQET